MAPMTPLNDKPCRHCGAEGPHEVTITANGPHYAKVHCRSCLRMIGWLPKPDAEKTKRSAPHRALVAKYSRGFCEMCLCSKQELPRGETLEGHHVIEFKDNGEPTRENTWILCTTCHSLVNWRRTAVRHVRETAAALRSPVEVEFNP